MACEPVCALDEKGTTVRVVFSFALVEADGQLIELSWSDTRPQENGKCYGGTARCLAQGEGAPVPLEVRLPLALFLEPRRVDLKLRTMKPLRSLGHGNGLPEADPADVSATVAFKLRAWSDLT
jgi:hypothetical protein